jgi:hypothetical protein
MASDEQFYADAAQQRLRELDAMRMRVQSNLQTSLSENDRESAAEEIEQIASIDARKNHLIALAQSEANRNQPAPPRRTDACNPSGPTSWITRTPIT